MRPFQIIIISVFAVLALAGLYLFATFKGFNGGKPVGNVIIWGTLPITAIQPAIDNLHRTHKEFGTLTYLEQDPGSFDSALSEALASGRGPDLIVTDQERVSSERGKLSVIPFSSISERTYRDTYLPVTEQFLTSTGTYGIPFAVDPLVLYYNRARLATANIPQPPSTWEAVVGAAPRLTLRTAAGIITKPTIPFGTYENIEDARAIVSLLLLQSGNHITQMTATGPRSTLGSSGEAATYGATSAESALNFYTQFADPAKTVYTWNRSIPDARQSFTAGDAAFYVGFASEQPVISASNPNLDFDMVAMPQPETSTLHSTYAVAYAFAIPKASKNSVGAYRTATALAAKDEAGIIAHALGIAPAMRALLVPSANDRYAPVVYQEALIAKGWLSPAPYVTDRIFADMINSIISGRASVHDALTTADESLTAALQ